MSWEADELGVFLEPTLNCLLGCPFAVPFHSSARNSAKYQSVLANVRARAPVHLLDWLEDCYSARAADAVELLARALSSCVRRDVPLNNPVQVLISGI